MMTAFLARAVINWASRSLALLLIAAAPLPVDAQGVDFGGEGPVEVEADDGIEWRREDKVIVARGNARATRGESTITADQLTAFYREADGGEQIYRFEAEGNVEIVSGARTFHGDKAVYEADEDKMVLLGDPARSVSPDERLSAQESIEFRNSENVAVARGDVRVERGDEILRADVVTARFAEGDKGNMHIREIEADGDVHLSTPTDIVRARHATYDVSREVATLTGSVKITRGPNQLNGDTAEVNLRTGVSRLRSAPGAGGGGRVRALLFTDGAGSGAGSGQ